MPGFRTELHPRQEGRQKQRPGYSQQQFFRLLSMNASALEERIRVEAERNPCLEFEYASATASDVLERLAAAPVDFRQQLRLQIAGIKDARLHQAAVGLIEALNGDGFLEDSLQDLAGQWNVPPALAEQALCLVQSLDPPGVGARTAQECYLLQLRQSPAPEADALAVVERAWEPLERQGTAAAAQALDWTITRLTAALERISRLTLHPVAQGNAFDVHVIPDAQIIQESPERYTVRLLTENLPQVRLSPSYLMQSQHAGSRFVNEGLYYAKRFLSLLEQRDQTLRSVLEFAANRQADYLKGGFLHRLPQQTAAQALHLHPSTVARAVRGKYFLFQDRVFPAASLFCADGEGEFSAMQIKSAIRDLIAGEDSAHPYSDQTLAQLLYYDYMVSISRRTVAKYRTAMGIRPAKDRRKA